jgi:hypothetical protein
MRLVEDKQGERRNAEMLLRKVQTDIDGAAEDGTILNDLLAQFHKGFPVGNVLRLLRAKHPQAIRAGAWIASELGSAACPLFEDIRHFLSWSDEQVRFCVIDCVLLCATEKHADAICQIGRLVTDPAPAVRWKALETLVRFRPDQIRSAAQWVSKNEPGTPCAQGFALMAEPDVHKVREAARELIAGPSHFILKRLAFVGALRARTPRSGLDALAASSADEDIQAFWQDYPRTAVTSG